MKFFNDAVIGNGETRVALWVRDNQIICEVNGSRQEPLPDWVQDECINDRYHAAEFVAGYLGLKKGKENV